MTTTHPETQPEIKPVTVSPEATHALGQKVREWTGLPTSRLVFGKPTASPFADWDHQHHVLTANPDRLILNPNRVLLTVTPFRLRQEAVLTGCMLHEVGHARHSHWKPRNPEEVGKVGLHSDGSQPTPATMGLAMLMEEPRIEGLIAAEADKIGALGLGWTMRAAAAHNLPMTNVSADPNQRVMDVITSWALRAGRQVALQHTVNHRLPRWVQDFTTLLNTALVAHFGGLGLDEDNSYHSARIVIDRLIDMVKVTDDTGPTMLDMARDTLALLFPETDPEDQPQPEGGCQSDPDEQEGDESEEGEEREDESGAAPSDEDDQPDEGEAEPEDSTDEGAGEDESDEQESDGGEGQPESDDAGEGQDDEGEGEPEEDESEEDESESGASGASTPDEAESGEPDPLADLLSALEKAADGNVEDEAEDEADKAPPSTGAGEGGTGHDGKGYRVPDKAEREISKGAEKFLRELISPTESSKVLLTESPAATVDGAAMAAWKAGGMVRDPKFFRRTRRTVEPSPPVKIAVLVDVSGSMEDLQAPSALLSWALTSAALDLRNFAGRGQQVESTLIHWGSTARVIQKPGDVIPGIREYGCFEGTWAMHDAMDLAEEMMPGFYEVGDKPVNRLLVHFTDWDMGLRAKREASERNAKAMAAGVNIISIVPEFYSARRSVLADVLADARVQRGTHTMLKYDPRFPGRVWDEAAKALGASR